MAGGKNSRPLTSLNYTLNIGGGNSLFWIEGLIAEGLNGTREKGQL
jgi:hypothetical protein